MGPESAPEGFTTQGMTHPFNAPADDYDREFTSTRLGRWLREPVWRRLDSGFGPGDTVLELGCGTGADAVWLAGRGVRVVATDVAPAMLELARRKVMEAGVTASVAFRVVDINNLPAWTPALTFDGLLSNFGALNCVSDCRSLARTAAGWVRPGGRVVLVVMGPFCPWEMVWHLLHGDIRTALRRLRSGGTAHIGAGASVPVWYPSPQRLRSQFAPFFRHVETVGLGVLLPPTYLQHVVERWPTFFKRLAALEGSWRSRFPWTLLNDHYLMVLERRGNRPEPLTRYAAAFEPGGEVRDAGWLPPQPSEGGLMIPEKRP